MTAIIWSIEITGRRGDPRTKFLMVWRLCLIGIGSGAAMIPYAIIKEVNPDKVKGSATGAINSLVFTLSVLLAPAYGWLLNDLAGGGKLTETVFRNADSFGVAGIMLAIVLACFLRETGSASHAAAAMIQTAKAPA